MAIDQNNVNTDQVPTTFSNIEAEQAINLEFLDLSTMDDEKWTQAVIEKLDAENAKETISMKCQRFSTLYDELNEKHRDKGPNFWQNPEVEAKFKICVPNSDDWVMFCKWQKAYAQLISNNPASRVPDSRDIVDITSPIQVAATPAIHEQGDETPKPAKIESSFTPRMAEPKSENSELRTGISRIEELPQPTAPAASTNTAFDVQRRFLQLLKTIETDYKNRTTSLRNDFLEKEYEAFHHGTNFIADAQRRRAEYHVQQNATFVTQAQRIASTLNEFVMQNFPETNAGKHQFVAWFMEDAATRLRQVRELKFQRAVLPIHEVNADGVETLPELIKLRTWNMSRWFRDQTERQQFMNWDLEQIRQVRP